MIHFDLYYLIIFWGNIYINGNRNLPWSMATKTLPKCKSFMYVKFAILSCFYGRILSCFFLLQNHRFMARILLIRRKYKTNNYHSKKNNYLLKDERKGKKTT